MISFLSRCHFLSSLCSVPLLFVYAVTHRMHCIRLVSLTTAAEMLMIGRSLELNISFQVRAMIPNTSRSSLSTRRPLLPHHLDPRQLLDNSTDSPHQILPLLHGRRDKGLNLLKSPAIENRVRASTVHRRLSNQTISNSINNSNSILRR